LVLPVDQFVTDSFLVFLRSILLHLLEFILLLGGEDTVDLIMC
jgi:hypothetical protein